MEIQGRLRFTPLIVFVFPCVVFWQNKTKQIHSWTQQASVYITTHWCKTFSFSWDHKDQLRNGTRKSKKKKGETPIALYRLRWTSFFSHLLKSLYPWNFEVQPAKGFEKACNLPTMTRQRISQALQDRVERGRKRAGGGVAPFSTRAVYVRAALPPARAAGD